MQGATDSEGKEKTERLHPGTFPIPAQARDDAVRGRVEGEAEGLVPPAAPPASETLLEDSCVAAVGVGVHPGVGAGADAGGADEADEEKRRDGEEELEGGVDEEEDEGEAGGAEEGGGGGDGSGEGGGWGRGEDAPEVGVLRREDFAGVEGEVAEGEGEEFSREEGPGRLVAESAGGADVRVAFLGRCAGVERELVLHPGWWRGYAGDSPVPAHASEVADEIGDPVYALGEGLRETLPRERAGLVRKDGTSCIAIRALRAEASLPVRGIGPGSQC